MKTAALFAVLLVLIVLAGRAVAEPEAQSLAAAGKPRLLVLTDIGGDPDDQQSMIRLMLYSNEFDIEGLVASASGTPGELKEKTTKAHLIRQIVEAFSQVRERLITHAPGYPTVEQLRQRIKSGNPHRGLDAIGDGKDTEGSGWIIEAVDRPDPRPLHVAIWGGQTDLAQALWRVREDRGPEGLARFISKLRVYDIADQDRIQPWIFENFRDLFHILAKAPPNADMRTGAFRGMYLGGDESLTSRDWIDSHVRIGHGPLGALYPNKTWTAPNPHGVMKEGDTPSWFYFLPNGLSDVDHPEWGCWGGRFTPEQRNLFRDAQDTVGQTADARTTVWRWRPAFQADLQARMDWCVKPFNQTNHRPAGVVNGDRSGAVLRMKVAAGQQAPMTAAGSSDPDGNPLAYRWWIYREAGSYTGPAAIRGENTQEATMVVPADASGKTIHVILEISDNGTPALTSYRRIVLEVR